MTFLYDGPRDDAMSGTAIRWLVLAFCAAVWIALALALLG